MPGYRSTVVLCPIKLVSRLQCSVKCRHVLKKCCRTENCRTSKKIMIMMIYLCTMSPRYYGLAFVPMVPLNSPSRVFCGHDVDQKFCSSKKFVDASKHGNPIGFQLLPSMWQ